MKIFLLTLPVALALNTILAQNPSTSTNTAPRRDSSALVSPEIHPDRSVTFRLRAPKANEVKISGEWPGGSTTLTNNEEVWTATLGPMEPDIYGYSFSIDGVTVVDPANPWVKPMRA